MEATIGTKEEEEIAFFIEKLVSKLVRKRAKLNQKLMVERKMQNIKMFLFFSYLEHL